MRAATGIRRVILVVLDGLRSDAIDHFDLVHTRRLMECGASSLCAQTVAPSVTTAAITSLLSGVSPAVHGIASDRLFIPKITTGLVPVPEMLERHGYPSAGFMAEVSPLFRGIAARIGRRLGFGTLRLSGKTAPEIMLAARTTLRTQRRGLVMLHWPDADRAGHTSGWMSKSYEEAARRMDGSLGLLAALTEVESDPHTVLVGLADHGGGGVVSNDHESDHPLDRTIPLFFAGGCVTSASLGEVSLLDVPATILWALGLDMPPSYQGCALRQAFVLESHSAVAVA
jgi:arylsulfatase A-like enzyme